MVNYYLTILVFGQSPQDIISLMCIYTLRPVSRPVDQIPRRLLLRTDDLDHLLCGNLYFYIHHSKRIPRYGGIKTIKKSLSEVQTPDRDFL